MWPHLAAELGADLEVALTGGLMVAEDERSLEQLRLKAALEMSHGTRVDVLAAEELRRLAPYLSERLVGASWCAGEGKINPMAATAALLAQARRHGAVLVERAHVEGIDRVGGLFRVKTGAGVFEARKVLNAAGGWSAEVAAMVGLRLPVHASPLQMIVTEPVPPIVPHLVAHADRHLTLKQTVNGNLIIGGGWRARLDREGRPAVLLHSLEGNLWVAQRILPFLRGIHVLRSWAATNVAIDGAPILGEACDCPGFYNSVTVNGVTLAPIIGRLTAQMMVEGRCTEDLSPSALERFNPQVAERATIAIQATDPEDRDGGVSQRGV